jgi:hypothetical protein
VGQFAGRRSIQVTGRGKPRALCHPRDTEVVYDGEVRRAAIVCAILAGSARAHAQPPATESALHDRQVAEEHCAARDPSCDWIATLSSLERASVARALAARGYEQDPAPWGKVIGAVRVYNEEVFAEPQPLLQFFNIFHMTTKESAIRSQAVIAAGQIWDQDRVEETARLIRDPLWSSVVAVIPVKATAPGTVDVLIVTRDIWSLRFNTNYTFQQGKLTNLVTSISENNFLGRRDVLSATLTMDQGAIAFGPLFIDKNVLGEHFDFRARVDDIVTRDNFHHEGSDSTITLSRPLWSLASEWAAGASFSHRFAITRQYLGTALRNLEYPDPITGMNIPLPRQYEMRLWSTNAFVTRQWGDELKQQFSIGHSVVSQRPHPLDSFPGDDMARAFFIKKVLPVSEVTSTPYIEYSFFTPRYRTLHNVTSFDLAEDLRTGPDLDISLAFGLEVLGSDHNFQRLSSSLGWTFPLARDGFVRVAGGLGGRLQDGRTIDDTATVLVRGGSPPIGDAVRLLVQSSVSTRWHDTQNGFYAIGSDSGLRGFSINEFSGLRLFSLQAEARTLPYPVWVLRLGAVAFYDLGGADKTFQVIALHQDAGLGLRMLIPQLSSQLYKFDFAVPFDGANRGKLAFIAGFGSEF